MISVVLADDHVVVRTGIKMLLDADPDIEVVAEAAEGTEAYSLVARYKPDVLLLDISMPPGQSGLIACEKTAKGFPRYQSGYPHHVRRTGIPAVHATGRGGRIRAEELHA